MIKGTPVELNRELITMKLRVMSLESAVKRIVSFHDTHNEIEPIDYMNIVGGEIETLRNLIDE